MKLFCFILYSLLFALSQSASAGIETTLGFNGNNVVSFKFNLPNIIREWPTGSAMPGGIEVANPCGEQPSCDLTGKQLVIKNTVHLSQGALIYVNDTPYLSIAAPVDLIFKGTCTPEKTKVTISSVNLGCTWEDNSVPVPIQAISNTVQIVSNTMELSEGIDNFTISGKVTMTSTNRSHPPSDFNTIESYHFIINAKMDNKFSRTMEVIEECCGISGKVTSLNSPSTLNFPDCEITNKLTPESLEASFDPDSKNLFLEVNKTGVGSQTELGKIYLRSDGEKCAVTYPGNYKSPGICAYSLTSTTVAVACPDPNLSVEYKQSNLADMEKDALLGTLVGTWGHVNIDTTCAITVTIPYE